MKELPTITLNFYKCLKNFLTAVNPEKIKSDLDYRTAIQKSADSTKRLLRRTADELQRQYTNALEWGFPEHHPTPVDVSAFVNRLLKNSCALVDETAHGNLAARQLEAFSQNDNPAKMLESVYAYKNN